MQSGGRWNRCAGWKAVTNEYVLMRNASVRWGCACPVLVLADRLKSRGWNLPYVSRFPFPAYILPSSAPELLTTCRTMSWQRRKDLSQAQSCRHSAKPSDAPRGNAERSGRESPERITVKTP